MHNNLFVPHVAKPPWPGENTNCVSSCADAGSFALCFIYLVHFPSVCLVDACAHALPTSLLDSSRSHRSGLRNIPSTQTAKSWRPGAFTFVHSSKVSAYTTLAASRAPLGVPLGV